MVFECEQRQIEAINTFEKEAEDQESTKKLSFELNKCKKTTTKTRW